MLKTKVRTFATAAVIAAVTIVASIATTALAQPATRPVPSADSAAVYAAVLDYVNALYDVRPELIERSVHPTLTKVGFFRRGDTGPYQKLDMTYGQLRALAGSWNSSGQVNPKTAPKVVVVLDVLDQTATAKLTAEWGTDYMHLAKYDGRWKIVHVLWQSPVLSGR